MSEIKGYVVRAEKGPHEYVGHDAMVPEAVRDYETALRRYDTVRILAVAEDGTETPVPSYAEALAQVAALREDAQDAAAKRAEMVAEIERLRERINTMGADLQGAHGEAEALRREHTEALAALRKLFTATRALLDARETSYQESRTVARASAARLRELDEASEEVRHLAEDEQGAAA